MGGHGPEKLVRDPALATRAVQDVPPKGGYKDFAIRGNAVRRGPPGWALWGGVIALSAYGMYQLSVTNYNKRNWQTVKRESRMAILPYIVAEQDILKQKEYDAELKKEAEIMKNVPNWEVGKQIYSKRWMKPTPGIADMNDRGLDLGASHEQ